MEWLISSTKFKARDRSSFDFDPSQPCKILAIKVEGNQNGEAKFEPTECCSVSEYKSWIKRCRPTPLCSRPPTLLLALHKRLENDLTNGAFAKSTSLAYDSESFRSLCEDLCQHRTLGSIIARKSTAVFSSRSVIWKSPNDFGRSMGTSLRDNEVREAADLISAVYHCKSDTESLTGDNDLILSTTCFTDVPITLAVMYGCTDNTMELSKLWIERCKASVFHPLVLPMIFAEHERKRLFNAVDHKSTELEGRILELEQRVKQSNKEVEEKVKKDKGRQTMTERDCEAIQLWRSMSALKNGLESFYSELGSMRDHLHTLPPSQVENDVDSERRPDTDPRPEVYIDARLKEMMSELKSKIRSCEGFLGGMTLATQMEWNYYTRRDAHVNFSIATATKMDGSQMKQISLLGTIFLPGTFLATFFSMTFFSWMPQDSSQVISPWLGLYGGLTLLLTAGTILWLRKFTMMEIGNAKENLQDELDNLENSDSTLFGSKRTMLRPSLYFRTRDDGNEDVELG